MIKRACDCRLQAVHWLRNPQDMPYAKSHAIAQGQYPEAERWLTRSR